MIFGLQELFPTVTLKLLGSVLVMLLGIGIAYLVRRLRRLLTKRLNPIAVDIVSSGTIVAIVIITALSIADIWGQSDTLLAQVGFLEYDQRAPQLVVTLIIVMVIQVLDGISRRFLDDLQSDSQALTRHQREVSLRVTQLTLWGGGVIIILGLWNVDIAGLLVGAGFFGIVIGLASRKTIGSLIAGFVLMFSRPFEIGDWIVVGDEEGTVSEITLMSTRIQGFDGEYVIIPNDVVSNEIVINRSRNRQLRMEVEVGVDYDADVERAREVALETAKAVADDNADMISARQPEVVVDRFGDSAVILAIRLWIDAPTPEEVAHIRTTLIGEIKTAFESAEIGIPYPQRELSGRDDETGASIAPATGAAPGTDESESISSGTNDGE